jgi:hypothetical protein
MRRYGRSMIMEREEKKEGKAGR